MPASPEVEEIVRPRVNELRSIYDVIHAIYDKHEDEGDRCHFGSTNDPHTLKRQLRRLERVLDRMDSEWRLDGEEALKGSEG